MSQADETKENADVAADNAETDKEEDSHTAAHEDADENADQHDEDATAAEGRSNSITRVLLC